MKTVKITLAFAMLFIIFIAGCSKSTLKPDDGPEQEPVSAQRVRGAVFINNHVYPTITIGNREWTTENYHGDGGIIVPFIVVPPEQDTLVYGRLYTEAEAKAIVLPSGWRLPNSKDFIELLRREMPDYKRGANISPDVITRYMAKDRWQFTADGSNVTDFKAVAAGCYAENVLADTIHYGMGTMAVYLMVDTNTIENSYKRSIVIEKTDASSAIKMRDIMPVNLYSGSQVYNINNRYTLRFVRDKPKAN
ncbi:MAG: hypothetical protein EOP46_17435 [Sphingobacteriaceae bacterium]|nr:MAG: hypothetical protein EOP46_17435 [Sphingobacteriaceae bacterium]